MWKYTKTTKQIESLYITKGSFLSILCRHFRARNMWLRYGRYGKKRDRERGDTRYIENHYKNPHIFQNEKESQRKLPNERTPFELTRKHVNVKLVSVTTFLHKKQPPKRRDIDKIGVTNMDLFNCTKIGEIAVRLPVQFRPQIGHKQTNKNYETGTELQMLFLSKKRKNGKTREIDPKSRCTKREILNVPDTQWVTQLQMQIITISVSNDFKTIQRTDP